MLFKHYVIKPSEFVCCHSQILFIICCPKMPPFFVKPYNDIFKAKIRKLLRCLSEISHFLNKFKTAPVRNPWVGHRYVH